MIKSSFGRGILPVATALSFFLPAMACASILTVFDGIPAGTVSFDDAVTAADGAVVTDVWSALPSGLFNIVRPGYTITRSNGTPLVPTSYGTMSGQVIGISPDGRFPGRNGTIGSGITFTFDDPLNAIGFEVGDWATCCFNPTTDLFISFDGGAPIMVASASSATSGRFANPNGNLAHELFVAAFDDSSSFRTVRFWGNGSGEFLVAGGQVRYSLLEQGSLTSSLSVPEPAPLALIGLGFAGLVIARRRKTRTAR